MTLTRRQQAILEVLRDYEADGLPAPSLSELCEALELSSRGSLHKQIEALIQAGLVEPMEGKRRGVRLTIHADERHLPLLGRIAAGRPIEAINNPELVEVPQHLRGKNGSYVLEVKGDSMIEAGIMDGDWVVIEERNHARNGEIVVALVDDNEATLKRIEQRRGKVILYPANSALQPMEYPAGRVQIQGVLVGLMRRY